MGESEDEDEDEIEEEVEEVVDELKDQETFEALISEDDEVVRPPSKRKQPKIRKRSSGSDEDSDESIQEIKPDKNPADKNTAKGRRIEQPKLQDKKIRKDAQKSTRDSNVKDSKKVVLKCKKETTSDSESSDRLTRKLKQKEIAKKKLQKGEIKVS